MEVLIVKFEEQSLPGVYFIEPEPFVDQRGLFRRHFSVEEFSKHGIITDISQANISENKHAYTLRGFHYQLNPFEEGKTLSCLRGAIYDIIVDVRPDSPTFMKWISIELNEENRMSIHVAPGCANAFLTLKDNSLIHYYCSKPYNPRLEKGIRYNDPLFNFKWPSKPRYISEKDKNHPVFAREKC